MLNRKCGSSCAAARRRAISTARARSACSRSRASICCARQTTRNHSASITSTMASAQHQRHGDALVALGHTPAAAPAPAAPPAAQRQHPDPGQRPPPGPLPQPAAGPQPQRRRHDQQRRRGAPSACRGASCRPTKAISAELIGPSRQQRRARPVAAGARHLVGREGAARSGVPELAPVDARCCDMAASVEAALPPAAARRPNGRQRRDLDGSRRRLSADARAVDEHPQLAGRKRRPDLAGGQRLGGDHRDTVVRRGVRRRSRR